MILLIVIAIGYYRAAKARALNGIVWALIAVVSCFVAQFLAGVIIGLINPQMLKEIGLIYAVAIASSILALIFVSLAMNNMSKKEKAKVETSSDDLLDDSFKID